MTRFGSTPVNAATRSNDVRRRREQPACGVDDERLGLVHDLRRDGGHHDAPDRSMAGWIELAEEPVLDRYDDARRLHPGCVREMLGVAQHRAGLVVTRDIAHSLRD